VFSRHTRVAVLLALFNLVWTCAPATAQEIETHQGQKLVTFKTHQGPRPVTYEEGEAIVQATLLHRAQFRGKPDCSHFVHDVYTEAGLDYDYAPTNYIFDGIGPFQRVQKPQPGDVIVWRGHTGIVIDPEEHSFYSSVISGFSIHNDNSSYWTRRGAHRFYRYKINDLQSARLLTSVTYHGTSLALANSPAAHEELLFANGKENRESYVAELDPSTPQMGIGAGSDSVLVESRPADLVPISSGRKPGKEEIGLAVTEFTESNAQELLQAAALNGPIEIIDYFEVARIETQDSSGSVEVKIKKIAFFADGKMRPAHSVEKIRLSLVRQAKGWVVLDTANRTYVLRQEAVRVIASRLALLARASAGAQQLKPLTQALGMLLANDHS
jgi:NlpC/P60 family